MTYMIYMHHPEAAGQRGLIPSDIQQALCQFKAGKAAGPDGIAPDHKHLSTNGSSILLPILKSSRLSGRCLQSWYSAYIVHFLKKQNHPADVGSYRSIALTSTIWRVLDRLITVNISVVLTINFPPVHH